MSISQYECDRDFLVALSIVRKLHQKGMILDSELVKINAILAEKFSASETATTLKLA